MSDASDYVEDPAVPAKPDVPDHVQDAIRTLISWAGDDPTREGLLDTPKRVGRAWLEYCQGYKEDPAVQLSRVFEEVGGYDEIVLLKDIPFQSHCEHHMAPITGKASIAYLPDKKVIGLSKIPRIVEMFARRLQVQERMTQQIAQTLGEAVNARGVGVVVEAQHLCAAMRGVRKPNAIMTTSAVRGLFKSNASTRQEFMNHLRGGMASLQS